MTALRLLAKAFCNSRGNQTSRHFAADMNLPEVLEYPSKLADEYAFETALWFFQKNGLFAIADDGVSDDDHQADHSPGQWRLSRP